MKNRNPTASSGSGLSQSVGSPVLFARSSTRRTASVGCFVPRYLQLHESGELRHRGEDLWEVMGSCRLCPRECGVNRFKGQKGFCQSSAEIEISSYHPHFGEELPLRGRCGSGTVFLTNCGLRCIFCINWEVSQGGEGKRRSVEDLAELMIDLQRRGCHNINLVTPTHFSPHILLALDLAAAEGLRVPLVYNSCGWEREEVLRRLDGVVDIYLADFKYFDEQQAHTCSAGADSYPAVTKRALLEMHRQVGVATPAGDGMMYKGLMIRHLVMPNDVGGTKALISWISDNLPKETYLNLMSQYRPVYKAFEHDAIARRITAREYGEAVRHAQRVGLSNLELQGYGKLG